MKFKSLTMTTLALGAAVFSGNSFAANAAAVASGTVIEPIAIAKTSDLAFGKFAPGIGGSVTVSTSGARTGAGVILSTIGSAPTAASFDVTGQADATYSIAITPDATLSDGAAGTMLLSTFSDLTGGNATSGDVQAGGGTLSAVGAQTIYVGGTLTVGAAQTAGDYSGNITVAVEYN